MAGEIEVLIAEWERAKAGTLDFISAAPDALLGFKAAPDVFSFAEQFIHIGWANYAFVSAISGKANPYDKASGKDPMTDESLKASKAALAEFAGGSYDFAIDAIRALSPGDLSEAVRFHKWDLTRGAILSKALEHHAHHRGQTAVYFRLSGLKPPSERLF